MMVFKKVNRWDEELEDDFSCPCGSGDDDCNCIQID